MNWTRQVLNHPDHFIYLLIWCSTSVRPFTGFKILDFQNLKRRSRMTEDSTSMIQIDYEIFLSLSDSRFWSENPDLETFIVHLWISKKKVHELILSNFRRKNFVRSIFSSKRPPIFISRLNYMIIYIHWKGWPPMTYLTM